MGFDHKEVMQFPNSGKVRVFLTNTITPGMHPISLLNVGRRTLVTDCLQVLNVEDVLDLVGTASNREQMIDLPAFHSCGYQDMVCYN